MELENSTAETQRTQRIEIGNRKWKVEIRKGSPQRHKDTKNTENTLRLTQERQVRIRKPCLPESNPSPNRGFRIISGFNFEEVPLLCCHHHSISRGNEGIPPLDKI